MLSADCKLNIISSGKRWEICILHLDTTQRANEKENKERIGISGAVDDGDNDDNENDHAATALFSFDIYSTSHSSSLLADI